MRGVTFVVRSLMALVVVGFIANCGDDPISPDRTDPAAPPIAFATANNGAGLSITTDKDDYAPGDTVWFTGAGWTSGDSVDIALTDEPTQDSHNWAVGIGEDGGLRDSTYVVDINDLGVTFTLTATSPGESGADADGDVHGRKSVPGGSHQASGFPVVPDTQPISWGRNHVYGCKRPKVRLPRTQT